MSSLDKMHEFGSLSLGSRLKRLSDRLIQSVSDIYVAQDIPLNPTYYPLFNLVHQQGSISITEAAELLNVSHPAISKIASRMIKEGWLIKTADPLDERRQQLTATEQSLALLSEIQPVWQAIRDQIDHLMAQQSTSLLSSVLEFEEILNQQGFAEPALARLSQRTHANQVTITPWNSDFRQSFYTLNEAWINRYFDGVFHPLDTASLSEPESYYLAKGGYIWFAHVDDATVGCVALVKISETEYSISKLAVDESCQGLGIGRRLMLVALDKARELNAQLVSLETATKLDRAIQLYKNLGFSVQPHPNGGSQFARADVYMDIHLHPHDISHSQVSAS